jgi:hypothetical protein
MNLLQMTVAHGLRILQLMLIIAICTAFRVRNAALGSQGTMGTSGHNANFNVVHLTALGLEAAERVFCRPIN